MKRERIWTSSSRPPGTRPLGSTWYQTSWVQLVWVGAFLAFLWGLYQFRVRQFRREERKLREAIETIPAMAWIVGPDGAVQFRNRRWVEYTGLSQLGKEAGTI